MCEPVSSASLAAVASGRPVQLTHALQLTDDIAVFRFELVPSPNVQGLSIRPGQAIVLDFMDWIGPPGYGHMADAAPGSINDDRVRTWTVSSAHHGQKTTWFEITMREMKGGAVTGALFSALRGQPHLTREDQLRLTHPIPSNVVGVTGDFCLTQSIIKTLWIAGGIGITPFISMLSALGQRKDHTCGNVIIALATRDPEVFLRLMNGAAENLPSTIILRIDVFTAVKVIDTNVCDAKAHIQINFHEGRIPMSYWTGVATEREVFICGPGSFGDAAVIGLTDANVPLSKIHREGFY